MQPFRQSLIDLTIEDTPDNMQKVTIKALADVQNDYLDHQFDDIIEITPDLDTPTVPSDTSQGRDPDNQSQSEHDGRASDMDPDINWTSSNKKREHEHGTATSPDKPASKKARPYPTRDGDEKFTSQRSSQGIPFIMEDEDSEEDELG